MPTKSGRKVKAKRADTETETATQKLKTDREKEFSFFEKKATTTIATISGCSPKMGQGNCYAMLQIEEYYHALIHTRSDTVYTRRDRDLGL